MTSQKSDINDTDIVQQRINEAAQRALEEADRRKAVKSTEPEIAPEKGGQEGPEPTRFGDWEKGGLISDF